MDFKNKTRQVTARVARKKGYSHYAVDYALGVYYLMRLDSAKALPYFQTVLALKKDYADAWFNLAQCHYDLGQMHAAGKAFLAGYMAESPQKAKPLYYSAVCYASAEEYKTAYDVFTRLLKNHPDAVLLKWRETFVHVLMALNRFSEALPHIETLAQETTGDQQKTWRETLLHHYITLKMTDKAFSYAEWLTQVDTLEPKWWKALAHFNLQQDAYQDALVDLLAYSFLTPLTPDEIRLMADIHQILGIPDKAAACYETLLKARLEVETLKKVVNAYMRLYNFDAALTWIDKGLAHETRTDLLLLKGNLLFEANRFEAAAAMYRKISPTAKEKGAALLMLGYANWNMERPERAQEAFKKAMDYQQQHKEALNALSRLKKTAN